MSLCYHSEHLAWQQRVSQEQNRAREFNKTTTKVFSGSPRRAKGFFPKANQEMVPMNYKTFDYNLAYTFGGTKPIRFANFYSPDKRRKGRMEYLEEYDERRRVSGRVLQKYAEELKEKIEEERKKRSIAEEKVR
jgi:hypothetical protein